MQAVRNPRISVRQKPVRTSRAISGDGSVRGEQLHQDYLDALPIPAARIALHDGKPLILAANSLFQTTNRQADMLRLSSLGRRVSAFLNSAENALQFDWRASPSAGAHSYVVRLARLGPTDYDKQRCLLSMVDRTTEVDTALSLRHEMMRDSLTGLLNRQGFADAIEQVNAGGDENGYAVLVVDLNRFSQINVCMGSMAGDELIITVARRMVGALRANDILARIGGDEFAVLLRLADGPGDALHVAKRIEGVLAAPFRLSDFEIRVDCAIGCAISTEVDPGEDMVRLAQFALKRAKASGRTEVYQTEAFTRARLRFSVETELRRAIDGDRLRLAFQPIINLRDDSIASFEALARWTDESGQEVKPTDFIRVAEESGLIVPLGRWALDAAARTLRDWDAQAGTTLPVAMNVNLSAIQFVRDDVPRVLSEAISHHGLSGNRFVLELTESAVVNDPDRAARVMTSLKALDARLAMDDFGTGYSNLALLQRLPVDILKIDRSFVTPMLADRDKVAIVRAVLSLADALGMATTAEGVETAELSRALSALGCSFAQGYFYAQPLDGQSALAYLFAHNPPVKVPGSHG